MKHDYFDDDTVKSVLHSALAYNRLKHFVIKRITTIPAEVQWSDVISYYDLYELLKKIESEVSNND